MSSDWSTRDSATRTRRRGVAAIGVAAIGAAVAVTVVAACSTGNGQRAANALPANPGNELPAVLSHTMAVTVSSAHGCLADKSTYAAGQLLVSITNQDALGVNAVQLRNGAQIVGERANVPAGFTGSFAVSAPPGTYTLSCPGAAGGQATIRIVGASMPGANSGLQHLLDQADTSYGHYVTGQAAQLVATATALQTALAHNNLPAARSAYAKARASYGTIATVVEPFDDEINAHENEAAGDDWNGFHRIEMGLFRHHTTAGLAGQGAWLVDHASKLQSLVAKNPLGPDDLTHAAMDLLTGVFRSALIGAEEPYSHYDLLDVASNVSGARQAFASLHPALQQVDPLLTSTLDNAFASLQGRLNRYRCGWMPSGYEPFNSMTGAQVTALSQAVQAVVEPLSQVASKVVSG